MLERSKKITFRLNSAEREHLKRRVRNSNLSQEAYIRQLINGLVPADAPPPDYHAMMRELHCIGNNLNQLAQKAHVLGVMDVQRYDAAVAALNRAVLDIMRAVLLPRKIE